MNNVCNNGKCKEINYGNDFYCDCDPNYTGKLCDTFLQPCDSTPCQNNGICTNDTRFAGGYKCTCEQGIHRLLFLALLNLVCLFVFDLFSLEDNFLFY